MVNKLLIVISYHMNLHQYNRKHGFNDFTEEEQRDEQREHLIDQRIGNAAPERTAPDFEAPATVKEAGQRMDQGYECSDGYFRKKSL